VIAAHDASRRRFLRIAVSTGGALVVGFAAGEADAQDMKLPLDLIGDELMPLGAFVMVERDNRVVIGSRACEVGQGAKTRGPMLVAEELDVDWAQVRVVQLAYGYQEIDGRSGNAYGHQASGRPDDVARDWDELRKAGAIARALLLRAAAAVWQQPIESLRTESGHVLDAGGRRLSYGALARSAASQAPPDGEPALKNATAFRIIGRPARTPDAANVVRGRTRYAGDEFLTGMLVAVVARCPYPGGKLDTLDDTETRRISGVRDVVRFDGPQTGFAADAPLAAGIAVLADTTWAALQGRAALKPTWSPGPDSNASSSALVSQAHALLDAGEPGIDLHKHGDFAGSRKRARHQVSARYELPFLAHAMLEAPAVVAELREDSALIIAAVQDPDAASRLVAQLTGLPRTKIEIRLPRGGGSFGRRLASDFVAEAVTIARLAGRPVRLLWTQADNLSHDFFRPLSVHALAATLDRRNRIAGWSHACAGTPRNDHGSTMNAPVWSGCLEADSFPAGLVAHHEQRFHALEAALPRGAWRATADTAQAFAAQCFIDEIAFEVRRDAVELRLELLGEPRLIDATAGGPGFDTARMAEVLKRCAENIQWTRRRNDGRGVGIACHAWAGGYVAHALETSMEGERLRIHRAICVIDAGRVVNPLGLEAEVSAATVDGIGTALHAAITLKDGQVQQHGWRDYRLMPMAQAPARVEVHMVESSAEPVAAGDLAFSSVAPALANAIFATTTVRVRKLPLMPELLRLL